jgi:hypothetical protein
MTGSPEAPFRMTMRPELDYIVVIHYLTRMIASRVQFCCCCCCANAMACRAMAGGALAFADPRGTA